MTRIASPLTMALAVALAAVPVTTLAAGRAGGPRMAVYFGDGIVRALRAGSFKATATATNATGQPITLDIPVVITWPALSAIEVASSPGRLYTGITLQHSVTGTHADKSERKGLVATWRSSDPSVARVDRRRITTAACGSWTSRASC